MKPRKGTGVLSVIQSALSAAFGVQNKARQERDFKDGRPADFIIAGIIGTICFVLILVVVVKLVLSQH